MLIVNILSISVLLLLIINLFGYQLIGINGIKFQPVPFNKVPLSKINSSNGNYKIGADFSIDFGDETVIEKNNDTIHANDMTLHKNDSALSLELICDSNDLCGTTLAPTGVKIYLVDREIRDEQIANNSIANNSIRTLELADNDCGTQSIKDCANFKFSIPSNILVQNYSIVLDMSFDEAKWIFINPVSILS
ncbi:MAG TPA: hypothetical protein VH481_08985 [Nitrososphaeraceae archaeon]